MCKFQIPEIHWQNAADGSHIYFLVYDVVWVDHTGVYVSNPTYRWGYIGLKFYSNSIHINGYPNYIGYRHLVLTLYMHIGGDRYEIHPTNRIILDKPFYKFNVRYPKILFISHVNPTL